MPAINVVGENYSYLLSLRQSLMDAGAHSIHLMNGVTTTADAAFAPVGTNWPGTSCGYSAVGQLIAGAQADAVNGSRELVLQSAAQAGQFRAGDIIRLFNWRDGAAIVVNPTVLSVKGQRLILAEPGITGAINFPAGSIVGRQFTTDSAGVAQTLDVSATGKTPAGMGSVATICGMIQRLCSNDAGGPLALVAAPAPAAVSGQFSFTVNTGAAATDGAPVSTLIDDEVIWFNDAGGNANLTGLVSKIVANTANTIGAGNDTTLTISGIFDPLRDMEFLGKVFPVTRTLADGTTAAVAAPVATDTVLHRCQFLQGYIDAVDRPANLNTTGDVTTVFNDPNFEGPGSTTEGMGNQGPVMIAALLRVINQLSIIGGSGTPVLPLDFEEKLWAHVEGKRLTLAGALSNLSTAIVVEAEPNMSDIPFPLTGTVRVIKHPQQVNGVWGDPSVANANGFIAFTRQRGSTTLTLAGATGAWAGTTNPNVCSPGGIVELSPGQSGPIMKGYASTIDSKDFAILLDLAMRAVAAHTTMG